MDAQTLQSAQPTSRAIALTPVVDMVVNGLQSPHSQRAYRADLNAFLTWYAETGQTGFTKVVASAYRQHLKDMGKGETAINRALTAIRKLAREAADNGLIDTRDAESLAKVESIKRRGVRVGNWLTQAEAEALINTPDDNTLKGERDRALLAMLIGAGLRREELSNLTAQHLAQRDGRWCIVDIRGKRNKLRTVPIAAWVKALADRWLRDAGIERGRVFVALTAAGNLYPGAKDGTSSQAVMRCVKKYGAEIGRPEIGPHDLRRTYAKLARSAGAPLEQIQITLGHESLDTTRRYLGSELDYQNSPSDAIRLNVRMRSVPAGLPLV